MLENLKSQREIIKHECEQQTWPPVEQESSFI